MALKELYKKYFQKSIWFLYPNLGIKRHATFTPINTFIVLNDNITEYDEKLIVLHEDLNSEGFKQFEKNVLFKNRFFYTFKPCVDNKVAYIFTFQEHQEDWFNFLSGKYSLLSKELKNRIESYAGKNSLEWEYIYSFLYPDKHFELYATLLAQGEKDVESMQEILMGIGELCPPYNLAKESLKIEFRELDTL
ncbi:MAG TPA: hypothetical protein VGM30_10445 [Puia sp.]|jgi:hypothetical protein